MTAHIQIADIDPQVSYVVGAARSIFPVPFAFFENTDLVVTVNGDTILIYPTQFTVTGAGVTEGGTVTLVTAVTNTTVQIDRVLPIERVTDFPNSGPFDIPELNTQFDKIIAIIQQVQRSNVSQDDLDAVADLLDGAAQTDKFFASLAALQAASSMSATTDWVEVMGRADPNDGGRMQLSVRDTVPSGPSASIFTLPGPRYGKNVEKVLRPEQFGVYESTTSSYQGLVDLAAEVQWRGGGRVEFPDNKDLTIWGAGVTPDEFSSVFNLFSLGPMRWNFNGTRLKTPFNPYTGNRNLIIFALHDCVGAEFNDFWFEQTNAQSDWNLTLGTRGFYIINDCKNIIWNKTKMYGGHAALEFTRTTGSTAGWDARARDFLINGADIRACLYGCAFAESGDAVRANKILTNNCGRSLIAYNVHDQRWDIEAATDNGPQGGLDDVLISCNVDSTSPQRWNTTSDIHVNYTRRTVPFALAKNSLVGLGIGYAAGDAGTGSAHVQDIKFDVHVDDTDTNTHSLVLSTTRYGPDGNVEGGVVRGHVVDGFSLTGTIRGANTSGMTVINWWNSHDMTGETLRNIDFDFTAQGAGDAKYVINGRGHVNPIKIRMAGDGFLDLNDMPAGKCDISQGVSCSAIRASGVSLGVTASSSFTANSTGHRFLPGGMVEQWGEIAVAAVSTATFTFLIPFRATPYLLAMRQDSGGSGDFSAGASATQGYINRPGGATSYLFTWRAIGLAP